MKKAILVILGIVFFPVTIYFLPTIIVKIRDEPIGFMFLLNLTLSWTGIGWLVLLFAAFFFDWED